MPKVKVGKETVHFPYTKKGMKAAEAAKKKGKKAKGGY
jgi:hypothetical protein